MTTRQIMKRINRLLYKERFINEGEYREALFPIRLSQKQANAIAEYMKSEGISCLFDKIVVNPKGVYVLCVRFYPFTKNKHYMWWGLRLLTEDPTTCK